MHISLKKIIHALPVIIDIRGVHGIVTQDAGTEVDADPGTNFLVYLVPGPSLPCPILREKISTVHGLYVADGGAIATLEAAAQTIEVHWYKQLSKKRTIGVRTTYKSEDAR